MDEEHIADAEQPTPRVPAPIEEPKKLTLFQRHQPPLMSSQMNQKDMSGFEKSTLKWAITAVFMSAIAAVFVCLQWIVMEQTMCEMRVAGKQTDKLIEIAQLDQRAWIGAPRIEQEMGDQGKVIFKLFFKNVGKTSTTGLYIDFNVIPGEHVIAEISRECDGGVDRYHKLPGAFRENSIIPGEEKYFPPSRIPSHAGRDSDDIAGISNMKDPAIVGCIVYQVQPDDTFHSTGFWTPLKPSAQTDRNAFHIDADAVYTIHAN